MESTYRVSAYGVLGLSLSTGSNVLLPNAVYVGLILPFAMCMGSTSVMAPKSRFEFTKFWRWERAAGIRAGVRALSCVLSSLPTLSARCGLFGTSVFRNSCWRRKGSDGLCV